MISISVKQILSDSFIKALSALINAKGLQGLDMWALSDVQRKVITESKTAREILLKVFEQHGAVKQPDGSMKMETESMTPEARDAFNADIESVYAKKIELPLKEKIKLPATVTGISAADITELRDDIIDRG